MILTDVWPYIIVITILISVMVWQNFVKPYAIKDFAKKKTIPIAAIYLALFLLCVTGIVLLKNYIVHKKQEEDKKKRLANMRVILGAIEMYGMAPPTPAEKRRKDIRKLKNDWKELASRTRHLLPNAPDINMLNRINEEWSKYR